MHALFKSCLVMFVTWCTIHVEHVILKQKTNKPLVRVCKAVVSPAVVTTVSSLVSRYWSTSSKFARGSATSFNVYSE